MTTTPLPPCEHHKVMTWKTDDGTPVLWSCVECAMKFEPITARADLEAKNAELKRKLEEARALLQGIVDTAAGMPRADLEAENANLRFELQSARDINLAVVNRQQAEIKALREKLAQARQDEADAVRAADAVYEAQERAADAYRAGSSGY